MAAVLVPKLVKELVEKVVGETMGVEETGVGDWSDGEIAELAVETDVA